MNFIHFFRIQFLSLLICFQNENEIVIPPFFILVFDVFEIEHLCIKLLLIHIFKANSWQNIAIRQLAWAQPIG